MTYIFDNKIQSFLTYSLISMEIGQTANGEVNTSKIYKFSNAQTGKSGLSFGFSQFDLNTNTIAQNNFKKWLIESNVPQSDIDIIMNIGKNPNIVSFSEKNKLFSKYNIEGKGGILENNKNTIAQMDEINFQKQITNVSNLLTNLQASGELGILNTLIDDTQNNDAKTILAMFMEWSNQTGGLDITSSLTNNNGFIQYVKIHGGSVTLDIAKSYLNSQKYFTEPNGGNFNHWFKNIQMAVVYANKSINQNLQKINSTSDSVLFSLSNVAHAATITGYGNPVIDIISSLTNTGSSAQDPIIITKNQYINLDGQIASQQYYDYNNSNISQRTGWVVQGDSYFLVEKEGNNYLLLNQSNFQNLSNSKIIDTNNANWNNLYVWDGQSTYLSLSDYGLSSISTDLNIINSDENGNKINSIGDVIFTDGTIGIVADVNLDSSYTYTIAQKDEKLSSGTLSTKITITNPDNSTSTIDLSSLPNLHGYGVLSSLTASMISIGTDGSQILNNTLYQDTLSLKNINLDSIDYAQLISTFDQFLKDWSDTGTVYEGNTNIALPDTKMFNNYRLQVLDKYIGQAIFFEGHQSYIGYGYPSSISLNEAYQLLENNLISEFFIQSHLTNIQTYISYDVTNDQFTSQTSYNDLLTYISQTYPNISTDSSLYHVLSDIIYNSTLSQGISIPGLFNDLTTKNANIAAQMIMTGENIKINNDNTSNKDIMSLQSVIAGGKTYIWLGNINEQILYSSYNTSYIKPQSDTLFINDNLNNISITVNLSNIIFTNNSNNLIINNNELKNITEIDFKDQSITNNNNQLLFNNTAIITGDTSILNDNMYIVAKNATVTYDFSKNVNISTFQDTIINLVTTNTLTTKDITYSNDLLSITQNGYTITFQENNSDIQLQQNGKLITYLFNNTLLQSYSAHSSYSQTVISSEGIYAYDASVYNNNILIQNTTGTDTIYMSGHNSGTSENLNYTAGTTTKMFQTSATNIQIQSDNLTINLKNVMGTISSNSSYLLFSDLKNINNKDLINSQFNCIQSSGILETGYYGNFTDTLNADVNDIEIRYGTRNDLTDSDGHDIFIESMNGKITSYSNYTNINIYVTNDNTFSNGNIYSLLYNFSLSGVYDNGNIIFKTNNHEYKIMNAIDFVNHLSLSFRYNGLSASFNLNHSNINYNVTDTTFNANELTSVNTVNLIGSNTTVTENVNGNNTYNILSHGNYIINQNILNSDTINITSLANVELNGFKNGTLKINENSNQINISEDYKGALLLKDSEGYKIQIDNYNQFNGNIIFNDKTLNVYSSDTFSNSADIVSAVEIKHENLTLSGNGMTYNYTDVNAITLFIQNGHDNIETFNLSNNAVIYGTNSYDYNNQITINLINNNNFTMGNVATYTNIILNGTTLSYDYAWSNSNSTSSTLTSHMTINNVINYFNTGDNQDSLKINGNNALSDITTSLKRNIMSETQDSTITTTHNKILLSNNLNIIDNGSDNEIMLSNNQETISIASNDRLLINNATIDKVSFLIENGHLDIKNGLKEYALINMQSSQLATDINANISLSDGHSISVKNAFTFATDYEAMSKTGSTSNNLIDLVSQNDYKTLIGLYNN